MVDWVAMCPFISGPLGVITGASLMYVITSQRISKVRETARVRCPIIHLRNPGPLTVLASDNPQIVQRSIEEFEYPPCHTVDGIWTHIPKTLSAMYTSRPQRPNVLNTRLTQDYPKKRETQLRLRMTRTNGVSTQTSNLQKSLTVDIHET